MYDLHFYFYFFLNQAMLGDTQLTDIATKKGSHLQPKKKKKHKKNRNKSRQSKSSANCVVKILAMQLLKMMLSADIKTFCGPALYL